MFADECALECGADCRSCAAFTLLSDHPLHHASFSRRSCVHRRARTDTALKPASQPDRLSPAEAHKALINYLGDVCGRWRFAERFAGDAHTAIHESSAVD